MTDILCKWLNDEVKLSKKVGKLCSYSMLLIFFYFEFGYSELS